MAIVNNLEIDPAVKDLMLKNLKIKTAYFNPVIDQKPPMYRKRNLREFAKSSPLHQCSQLWLDLTQGERDDWNAVAAYSYMVGFDLFVQDTTYRIQNAISGLATPNVYHQYKVLKMVLSDASDVFYLYQRHEAQYYILRKNPGQKTARTPVYIDEEVPATLIIGFNYKATLESAGEFQYFGVLIYFHGTKGGEPAEEYGFWDLDLVCDWQQFLIEVTHTLDYVDFYQVQIMGFPVIGEFLMDNVIVFHTGTELAFNPTCDNILKTWIYPIDHWLLPWLLDVPVPPDYFDSFYIE